MTGHTSVLLGSFIELASEIKPVSYWDGTLGLAGHACKALSKIESIKSFFGSDTDAQMLVAAQERLKQQNAAAKINLRHENFSSSPFSEFAPFDIILLDLGISSLHLDTFERGISFRYQQTLDMRLDTSTGEPAHVWLNRAPIGEITQVLYRYGEESFAPYIARKIDEIRRKEPLMFTEQLAEICHDVYHRRLPPAKRHSVRHPAVKTFQAIRILVNRELEHLENALLFLPELLTAGGRLFIISFHSLEDRLVKRAFVSRTRIKENDPRAKSNYREGDFELITKKSIVPTKAEVEANPRSRSARMRVLGRKK